ncbi:hypothetical protein GPJ56_010781 [Histomonas meleagridis]|uniref:uncharacterized protein n=1 Tax=Histomonas meleagridis TaxID=135588 RepID=UPI00355A1C59|nr:hypothetical protein GPJ56_010781 [Histomonas meleagridis]KAH0801118.1 hypothetical protein GO595_006153 [Histomonas meleagridis]
MDKSYNKYNKKQTKKTQNETSIKIPKRTSSTKSIAYEISYAIPQRDIFSEAEYSYPNESNDSELNNESMKSVDDNVQYEQNSINENSQKTKSSEKTEVTENDKKSSEVSEIPKKNSQTVSDLSESVKVNESNKEKEDGRFDGFASSSSSDDEQEKPKTNGKMNFDGFASSSDDEENNKSIK